MSGRRPAARYGDDVGDRLPTPTRGRARKGAVTVVRGVLVAAAVAALIVALLWGLQRRLIYLPMGGDAPSASQALPGAADVTLETADGLALGAWHLPATEGAATVLVANGNAGHRGFRAPLAEALRAEGLGVLLFDYRGFGGNPGRPTEEGLALDVRAARAYLTREAGVRDDRLLYYGESLGSAVVVELATEHPPAGLVLRSPFTDLAAVGRRHYPLLPVRLLLWDRYPVAEQLRRVAVPTVVVLGTADGIVPPSESRAAAAAAAGPVTLVEVAGADHNDRVLLDGPELVGAIIDLADEVAPPR